MADDIALRIVEAARRLDRTPQFMVAKAHFNCFNCDEDWGHAVVCFFTDTPNMMCSNALEKSAGLNRQVRMDDPIPLQVLLNDGWRIEREYKLRNRSSEGRTTDTTDLIYVFVRDAPLHVRQDPSGAA